MSNKSLDLTPAHFAELLNKSSELVLDKFSNLEEQKAYHDFPPQEVESWFDESLPEEGMNDMELLDFVKEKVLDTATNNLGPYMYAYVMAGGSQMSIIGDTLAATINQNVGKWHLAPAISELEKRVIQWAGEMMNFSSHATGVLVSGGSAANLTGLTVARNIFFEKNDVRKKGLFGMKPITSYSSSEVHSCVDKSLDELGIGTDHLRKIKVNDDFTINLTALEEAIEDDIKNGFTPFCIVGTAGTVNTGAVDDLAGLAAISKKFDLWFHVDGAYGGLASSLDSIKDKYKGIDLADSLAVDFHKWLYQSFEAGCLLVKDWQTLRRSYFKKASYLDATLEDEGRLNFNEHYFQLSRSAKALKIWMSIKSYGIRRIKEMIQKDIDLTHYLADQIDASDDFELSSKSSLAVACFRYIKGLGTESEIEKVNQELIPALEKDGRVFITGTKLNGQFVIRACLINHRMHEGTVDYLLNVIRDVARNIR
ncbi:MAG: pyridoxal-dependent decarboxylase [Cyclobacteriaceae bacterium]